ncbi:AI-2E family transporter [Acinetobacter shaoyimingii]|uniref:AI-2E family transporter n=1 Tax=Acinetobacter shaoyimingii TaxID=2715164 RepID=A0A6G8RY54_9GAMM|nr:AI-2E family transporter [Acinetobacter shaoyimingii]QIO06780.1 AI-2E family transporter [Acinetobacter shaoyimingii]
MDHLKSTLTEQENNNHENDQQNQDTQTKRALRLMAGFVIATIIILALYYGKEILIPLALSVLLAFLLEPLVSRLKKWGLPQFPSIALVVLFALSVLGGAGTYLGYQLATLSQEMPQYQDTIEKKINSVKSVTSGPSIWDGAISTIQTVQKSMQEIAPDEQKKSDIQKVQMVGDQQSTTEAALEWGAKIVSPLATAGIVFLFVVLILLNRKDLHDRLLKLLGGNLNVGTDALDEAAVRIGTYLRMQLLVNATYGVPMAIGLYFIGVPAAIMWGMVAVVMRFIPYVGPLISMIFPITLAFAVDPTWNMVLWTLGLILLLELVSNNVIEPWLYGESTGLSTLAIIVAATFWTSLWGPIGLILSTPLTACILVLANYIPALSFMKVFIGSDSVLTPPERFYQRLVAGDVDDALEISQAYIEEGMPKKISLFGRHKRSKQSNDELISRKVNGFYEDVSIPSIRLFSESHNTDASAEHRLRMHQGLKLFNHDFQIEYAAEIDLSEPKVACLGARWEVDVLVSSMLAHGLNLRKVPAQSHNEALIQSNIDVLESLPESVEIVCLSVFHQQPQAQIRLLNHRLKTHFPHLKLVFATWGNSSDELRDDIIRRYEPDAVVATVNELMLSIDALLIEQGENPARELLNENEDERLAALHDLQLLEPETLPIYKQYIEEATQAFDVRYAQISLVDEDWVNTPGSPLADENANPIEAGIPREESICTHLVHQNEALIIEDIDRDPRFRQNPELNKSKIKFYAGVPLRTQQGLVLGSLCILDQHVRQMSEDDVVLLNELADDLIETLSNEKTRQQKLEEIGKLQQAESTHMLSMDS